MCCLQHGVAALLDIFGTAAEMNKTELYILTIEFDVRRIVSLRTFKNSFKKKKTII